MSDAIKEGSFLWTWYNELGSNFIGTFSFYNLFSPFSLIMYLFPVGFIPYLNGIFMILKYGVAGLISYLFLKRYFKDYKYAIIGSLLYTFSGFHLNNILFHFLNSLSFCHGVLSHFYNPLLFFLSEIVIFKAMGDGTLSPVVAVCTVTEYILTPRTCIGEL